MSVSYRTLDSGKHVLVVLKRDSRKVSEAQTIELNLQKDEFLSDFYSFRCFAFAPKNAAKKIYAYAVLNKSQVKEDIATNPLRAWLVNEKESRLDPVKDPKAIECSWYRAGDGEFPFKPMK
jgi:hypothetical protein